MQTSENKIQADSKVFRSGKAPATLCVKLSVPEHLALPIHKE
jgi:hypothetical protein